MTILRDMGVWGGGGRFFIMNLISTLQSINSLGYSSLYSPDTRPRSTRFRLALLEPVSSSAVRLALLEPVPSSAVRLALLEPVPSSAVRLALLEPVPSSAGRLTVLELVSFKSGTSHMLCVSFNLKKIVKNN